MKPIVLADLDNVNVQSYRAQVFPIFPNAWGTVRICVKKKGDLNVD